jgi:signal transduction histidine kinase
MSERRWPWIVLSAGAACALGALALATVAALRLEKAEALASAQAKQQESMRLALWRMDSTLAPLIARESARPYFHYEPYYAVDRMVTSARDKSVPGQVLVPSPLLSTPDDLIRLNFECAPSAIEGASLAYGADLSKKESAVEKAKAERPAVVAAGSASVTGGTDLKPMTGAATNTPRFGKVSSPQLAGGVVDRSRAAAAPANGGEQETLRLRLDQLSALLAMRPIEELESKGGLFASGLRGNLPATAGLSMPEAYKVTTASDGVQEKLALRRSKSEEQVDQESQSFNEYIARQSVVSQNVAQANRVQNAMPAPSATTDVVTLSTGSPARLDSDAGGLSKPRSSTGSPARGAASSMPGVASAPAPSVAPGPVAAMVPPGAPGASSQDAAGQMGMDGAPARTPLSEPAAVEQTEFRPIWLGEASNPELVFVRWVTVGSTRTLQGFWVDWPLLRERLLSSVEDLAPESRLMPISDHAPPPNPGRTLAAIPAELRLSGPAVPEVIGWTPVRTTLALTWGAFITALALGAWMMYSLSDLAERRGRFVSAVTHELRTPLTTFCLYSQMLADGMVREDEQRVEYLRTLKGESKRLAGIVENVLLFARLSRGARKVNEAPGPTTSVSELHERIIPALTRRAVEAGMDLVVEGTLEPSTRMGGDAPTLERILLNLVDNACKYGQSESDHRLHLVLASDDRTVRLTLSDHGPGVNASERESIFAAFSRSKQHANSPTPGLGLGLALARGLARELGGDLSLIDAGPGASFEVRLRRVFES